MARTGGKKAAKKASKGRKNMNTGKSSATTEPVNVQELRERVRSVVAEKLDSMTKGVADEAVKGHVAQLKYSFEVTGLYPGTEGTKTEPVDSNDLAKKLLDSFHFPASLPAEDDEEAELAVPAVVGKDSVE